MNALREEWKGAVPAWSHSQTCVRSCEEIGCEQVAKARVLARDLIYLDRQNRIAERHLTPQVQSSWDALFSAFRRRIPRDRYFAGMELLSAINRPRDQITKILFLCAVRRIELLVLKWKDFSKDGEMYTFTIQRPFDPRTHKIKEWNPPSRLMEKSLCRHGWPWTSKAGASTAAPTATIQNPSSFRPAMEPV
jgi:hypothetical protein